MLTVQPFLLMFLIGVAAMGLPIYQVCRREIGTVKIDAFRVKPSAWRQAFRRTLAAWRASLMRFWPLVATAAALLLVTQLASHGQDGILTAVVAVSPFKLAQQNVADVKAKGAKLVAELKAAETDEQRAALATQLEAVEQELSMAEATLEAEAKVIEAERRFAGTSTPRIEFGVDHAAERPWGSFGEQLVAIARAMSPNGVVDRRLHAAASGASAGEPSSGGFLIQQGYSEALLDRAREESPLLGECRQIPIPEGTESIDLPVIDETSRASGSRWGGVQVFRKAEAETVTSKKPKFGKLKIDTSEIMGIAYATERLLRNAATVEAVFGNAFASEFAFKVTDEIVRGGGGDECLGILNAPATVSQAKEGGQAAATVVMENLSNMWAHVPARSKARGAWYINNDVEPSLDKLYKAIGTGGTDVPFVTYDQSGVLRIKGRPVRQLEQCSTLGTVGDIFFFDGQEYILSPQGSITGASSMHVRFLYNEMTFRWTYYINGRPAWLNSLTPYKGSTTLAPYVTLATRA